jgi:hypothetical protein
VTKFSEEATPNASVGAPMAGKITNIRPRPHVSPMEPGQGNMLGAARPSCLTSDEPPEPEVAIAKATIHLIRAYELLETLDWRAACLATLPRFGDLDCAIRNICLALIVLADEGV